MIKFASAQIIETGKISNLKSVMKRLGYTGEQSDKAIQKISEVVRPVSRYLDDFLYTRQRAISAMEYHGPNINMDAFPEKELIEGYPSFIGSGFYKDHVNWDTKFSYGVNLDSRYNHKQHFVEIISAVSDRMQPDSMLVQANIRNGKWNTTSMGTAIKYSECSICHNHAETEEQYCLVPGTMVAGKGYVYTPIENIKEGDEVYTDKGRLRKVLALSERKVSEDIFLVKIHGIRDSLKITGNHPVLVADSEGFKWVKTEDLREGDWLVQPILRDTEGTDTVDPEYAELLGYYLSEGWTNIGGKAKDFSALEFTIGLHEPAFRDRIIELGRKFLGVEPKIYSHKQSVYSIRFHKQGVGKDFYYWCGKSARDKVLNPRVFNWSKEAKLALIRGFFVGDGSVGKRRGEVILSTSSMVLSYQMKKLMDDLGFFSHVYKFTNSGGPDNREKKSTGYHLVIASSRVPDFMNLRSAFIDYHTTGPRFTWGGKHFYKVESIEREFYEGSVYNISVEEDNSYIAGGVVVHNCDHIKYMKGQKIAGQLVYEINHGLEFFDDSIITTQAADPEAYITELLEPENKVTISSHILNPYKDVGKSIVSKTLCDIQPNLWISSYSEISKSAMQRDAELIKKSSIPDRMKDEILEEMKRNPIAAIDLVRAAAVYSLEKDKKEQNSSLLSVANKREVINLNDRRGKMAKDFWKGFGFFGKKAEGNPSEASYVNRGDQTKPGVRENEKEFGKQETLDNSKDKLPTGETKEIIKQEAKKLAMRIIEAKKARENKKAKCKKASIEKEAAMAKIAEAVHPSCEGLFKVMASLSVLKVAMKASMFKCAFPYLQKVAGEEADYKEVEKVIDESVEKLDNLVTEVTDNLNAEEVSEEVTNKINNKIEETVNDIIVDITAVSDDKGIKKEVENYLEEAVESIKGDCECGEEGCPECNPEGKPAETEKPAESEKPEEETIEITDQEIEDIVNELD